MNGDGQDRLVRLGRISGDGTSPVVAFLHSSSGSAGGFRRLLGYLRAAGWYVAFESAEPGAADECSVPAIAASYWGELRLLLHREPSADLVLVGWSFGGVLAVEIARLAEAEGRKVAQVILLDAATPDVLVRQRGESSPAEEVAALFGIADGLPEARTELDDEALAAVVAERLSREEGLGDLSQSDLLPYIRTHRWHLKALAASGPVQPCAAPVVQIRASDERGWIGAPADLGWSRALQRDVRVLSAAGTHHSLLSADHVRSLAQLIHTLVGAASAHPEDAGLPLSSAQSRLWFLWQLEPDGSHYTTQFGWRILGSQAAEVREAWLRLCLRHSVLRSEYRVGPGGEPRRYVNSTTQPALESVRITPCTEDIHRTIADLAAEHFRRPFDLRHGSVRAAVVEDGSDAVWLLVSCHHIAVDGWCLGVIERDLRQLLAGPEAYLPELRADYQDFVTWEQGLRSGPLYDAQLSYWAEALKDAEVSPPLPDLFEDGEPGPGSLRFRLSAECVAAVESSAVAAGVTLFAGLLTCLAIALQEWAVSPGVAVGVNLANRPRTDFEDVVGLFVDPVALWLKLSPNGRFDDAAGAVWDRLAGAFEHADVPYQDVVAATVPADRDPWSPLFWVMVNMDYLPDEVDEPPWDPVPPVIPPDIKFPFAVIFQLGGHGLAVEFLYPHDRYRRSTVERVHRRFEHLVGSAGAQGFHGWIPPAEAVLPSPDRFSKRFGAFGAESAASQASPMA